MSAPTPGETLFVPSYGPMFAAVLWPLCAYFSLFCLLLLIVNCVVRRYAPRGAPPFGLRRTPPYGWLNAPYILPPGVWLSPLPLTLYNVVLRTTSKRLLFCPNFTKFRSHIWHFLHISCPLSLPPKYLSKYLSLPLLIAIWHRFQFIVLFTNLLCLPLLSTLTAYYLICDSGGFFVTQFWSLQTKIELVYCFLPNETTKTSDKKRDWTRNAEPRACSRAK